MTPRYPDVRVRLRSHHPLALVSAVRHELRRSGIHASEIDRFTEQALENQEPARTRAVCAAWADLDVG